MTTANAYGQCLLCQLERGSKAYARHNHDLDICDKHKGASRRHHHSFDYVDDAIDLDASQPMRHDEQAEHDRTFNSIDKNR